MPLTRAFLAFILLGTLTVNNVAADDNEFEFEGVISSLPSTAGFIGDWVVAGRTVRVTSSTRIDQEEGSPAVGRRVEVEGVLLPDGSINATEIEVEDADDSDLNDFQFRGRLESLPPGGGLVGDWVISGRTIRVTSATLIQQHKAPLVPGAFVKVIGTLRPDGTIDARKVQTEKKEHRSSFEFEGPVQTIPSTSDLTGTWLIAGRTVHVTPLTRIETEDGPIRVGTVVEVRGIVRPDGSIDATEIEAEDEDDFEFRGIIESLPNTAGFVGNWVVDGRAVRVTSATEIDQEDGIVAVGALVEVEGTRRGDGSVDAEEIEVERSAGAGRPVPTFELHGVVEQLPGTANLVGDWVISGRTVRVTSATLVRPSAGAITVGAFVEVRGTLRADNTIDATSVEVERGLGNGQMTPYFALYGTVEVLPNTSGFVGDWVVSGRTVHVSPETRIQGNHRPLAVGSFVRVVGTLRPDGSVDARQIQVKRNDNTGRRVNFFEMFGTVESLPASGLVGEWRVSGLVVRTTSDTHFAPRDQVPALGSRVKIVGYLLPDGTLSARSIVVQGDVDRSGDFVTTHYDDFLGRFPDDAGRAFWMNEIEKCGSDEQCRQARRVNVSAAFYLSIEFQETGYLLYRLYVTSFGRRPTFAEFLADMKVIAEGVVVGQEGWQQRLEANKQAFIEDWVRHPSFVAVYGGLTNAQFVERLLANAGITLGAAERAALVAGLNDGTLTRADVLRRIAESRQLRDKEFNRAFVLMQYFGYLRRDPDEAGFQFWLSKLNQFNGNFVRAEMVRAFIESIEFRRRFGK